VTPQIAIDTNAYRALNDGNIELARIIRSTSLIGLPIIVLGELYNGIFAGSKQSENLSNLNRFLTLPRLDIINIDELTAKLFGEIASELKRIGRPIQQNDIWIAALCKQYGYKLATNDNGFSNIKGLEIISF
jgi:tRNA(fMet)-specific endonuclease VapC